jgi:hypothetical protein
VSIAPAGKGTVTSMSKATSDHDARYIPENEHAYDEEVADHISLQGQWEDAARLNGHIASLLDNLGRHAAAIRARRHERSDLHEADHEGRQAMHVLLEEELEHDIHLSPDAAIAKVRAVQPHLHPVVEALHRAINQHVPAQDPIHREIEHVHSQLQTQLKTPVEVHQHAVATLQTLEHYFHLVQHLADSHEQIREVWFVQVEALMGVL